MDNTIIYEKKNSQFIQDCCNATLDLDSSSQNEDGARINIDDYVGKLITESVCVIMPERIEKREYFIDLAKEIAGVYLIDIVIRERKDRITVTYALDYEAGFSCLKPIIQLADELTFQSSNGNSAVFASLDYYTHATYRSGVRVLPL